MKILRGLLLGAIGMLVFASSALAQQVLYTATGSNGTAGTLNTIDPTNGAVLTSVAVTNAANGGGIGLTGIAFNPLTDTLYGVTVNSTANGNTVARSLVIINPLTGAANVIGQLSIGMSDISFGPDGTLYGLESQIVAGVGAYDLAKINLTNAAVTTVGDSGLPVVYGGGLAYGPDNNVYIAALGAGPLASPTPSPVPPGHDTNGTLDKLNPTTGARTVGPTINGALYDFGVINAMAFNAQGVLYAVNSDQALPADVELITINLVTGAVTEIEPNLLPDNTDAIAFGPAIPEPSTILLVGLGAGALALSRYRRRKPRDSG